MTSPLLEINDVHGGYPGKTVLHGIRLAVASGEIISIIGPNGAGKTTLLKSLTGIIRPDAGEIRIQGRRLEAIPRRELARLMAVVGQTMEQPFLSVEEYVLLGRLPYFSRYQLFQTGRDRDIAGRYLALTGIEHLRDAPMNEISGGEKQLAALARALVQEPAILLLDEPTAHLDITHQARVMNLVADLNRRLELTVVMVVHDLNLAAEYSDRLVLLDKQSGAIYRSGPPQTVLTEQAVRDVYHTDVLIGRNPASGNPFVFVSK
ncbi:MAG: ABC transporter ATP-binding protein [Desulfosudaceae bacterium]